MVSFYALAAIAVLSLFLTLLPFLGFPNSWNDAFIAVLGTFILGISVYSLYSGYVHALAKIERKKRQGEKATEKQAKKSPSAEEERKISVSDGSSSNEMAMEGGD